MAIDLTTIVALAEVGSDPAAAANIGKLYTKDVSGVTELFHIDSGGTVRQLTPSMQMGSTVLSGTAGSVLYIGSGPVLSQDNANFFWDAATARLGLGTNSPQQRLDVRGRVEQSDTLAAGVASVQRSHTGTFTLSGGTQSNYFIGLDYTTKTTGASVMSSSLIALSGTAGHGSTGVATTLSGIGSFAGGMGAAVVLGTISNALGVASQTGYLDSGGLPTSGTISYAAAFHANSPSGILAGARTVGTAIGLWVRNQGASGITTAVGIDIDAISGASTNIGIRTQSGIVIGETGFLSTEIFRVNGQAVIDTGLALGSGSAANPSSTYIVDTNTGQYRAAVDTLGWTTGGTSRMTLSTTALNISVDVVCAGTGTSSSRYGRGTLAGGTESTVMGDGATAGTAATNAVSIGSAASVTATDGIAIGAGASVTTANSIAVGTNATTVANSFVAGSTSFVVSSVFFGNGIAAAVPIGVTLNGTGGLGTDISGAAISLAGGQSTGTGDPGFVGLRFSRPAAVSGSTRNALDSAMRIRGAVVPAAFTAAADKHGIDIWFRGQDGGAHTASNPRGGDTILIPGAAGSGGTGRAGRVEVQGPLFHTGTLLGFFSTGPVIQGVSGADLTNNVTAGGTNNQIDDFAVTVSQATAGASTVDITTVALKSDIEARLTSIRNAIYQLARTGKIDHDFLRDCGLLS